MTGDMQGMLFGAISAAPDDAAEAGTAQRELRVCALNVNSAGPDRAQQLLEWMLSTKCNVLVLSEMKPGDGGRLLLTGPRRRGLSRQLHHGMAGQQTCCGRCHQGI